MPIYGTREYVIVGLVIALQSSVAVAMWRRQLYHQFRFFFLYCVAIAVQDLVNTVYIESQGPLLGYIYLYYFVQALTLALSFAVIYDVFIDVLKPYDALKRVGKQLFLWSLLGCVLGAVLFVRISPGQERALLFRSIYVTERSLRIVQVGVLTLLFTLSRSLGLRWRAYSFGIALGYGLYASVDLVVSALKLKFGGLGFLPLSEISSIAFVTASAIWMCYFLQAEAVAQPVRVIPYNDIAKWNEKLEELLKRKTA